MTHFAADATDLKLTRTNRRDFGALLTKNFKPATVEQMPDIAEALERLAMALVAHNDRAARASHV